MKNTLILLGCALFAMVPVCAEKAETPLGREMENLAGAFKAFAKETDSAKGAALAREAQQAALKGMAELPAMLKEMPAGPEKDKAGAAFRKKMGQVFVAFCEAEEAFLAGKPEEVAKIVTALKDLKKEGHKAFVKDED